MTQNVVNESITAEGLAAIAVAAMADRHLADHEHRSHDLNVHDDRIRGLETEASFHTASTADAVLWQICVASSQVDTLIANFVGNDFEGQELGRNIERLLLQVMRYVEAQSGTTREDVGLTFYSDRALEEFTFGRSQKKGSRR